MKLEADRRSGSIIVTGGPKGTLSKGLVLPRGADSFSCLGKRRELVAPQGQLVLVVGVHTSGVSRMSSPHHPGVGEPFERQSFLGCIQGHVYPASVLAGLIPKQLP